MSTSMHQSFDLSGRTALITGASRGIGRAIALGLAEAGADVVVHYAGNVQAAAEVVEQITALGRRAMALGADLKMPDAPARIVESCRGFGSIDILILNASVQYRRDWTDTNREEFDEQFTVNVRASLELIQALAPTMVQRKWGRIITVGSVQQHRTSPGLIPYGATKAAQEHIARNFARQLSEHGVTVNNLAPGLIDTDRTAHAVQDPATMKTWLDRIPARRVGKPSDLVGAALLLCSEAGAYITGVDLPVDGGLRLP
jgi:glucose 1-dehydrogenase